MAQEIKQLVSDAFTQLTVKRDEEMSVAVRQKCDAVVARYGNFESFMEKFNRDTQEQAGLHQDRVFLGNAPSLVILNKSYGEGSASTFIACHLNIVQNFCGIQKKLTRDELFDIGNVIYAGFYYLKVSELCLFFFWLKTGKYGKFYGCIDPIVITNGLQQFAKERIEYLTQYENRKRVEESCRLQKRTTAITYKEYLKLKQNDERKSE